MKGRQMLEVIEHLDPAFIEAASETPKAKKIGWRKWAAVAACLAAGVIAGIAALPGDQTIPFSVGGVTREYKTIVQQGSELAIVWPWEYKTVYERFPTIFYDGREYQIKTSGQAADKAVIGEKLGIGEGVGYDAYGEKEHRQPFNVWQIDGISEQRMIAGEMDGQFYTFQYAGDTVPDTLGAVLDEYSLQQTLDLSRFTVYDNGKETGSYTLADDGYIWQLLTGCRDGQFASDGAGNQASKDRLVFTATSQALGVYKRVFTVTADGYVDTNIFNRGYTFFIGEAAAADILSYAQKNGIKAEEEPYTYRLAGTLTEIGDGYILVDDTVLCADAEAGMVFKVLTTDLRVSRILDYGGISTGAIVVVTFTEPVNVEAGNVVSGAISMAKGRLGDDGVDVPE